MSDCTYFSVYLTHCQDRNNLWTLNKVVKSNSDYQLKEVKGGPFLPVFEKSDTKKGLEKMGPNQKIRDRFFREDFPQGSKQASHSLSIINSTWLNIFLTVNLATLPKLGVLLKKLKMLFNIFHKSFVYGHSNGQDVLVNFITIILSCSPSS